MHVDAHVRRKRVRTLAEAAQLDRDPVRLEPRREHVAVKGTHDGGQVDHAVGWLHPLEATVDLGGAQDLRARERVRRHLHPSRPAPPEPGRGGPLPVPTGRELGPVLERLSRERGEAVPRRRQPPRVRDARVRLDRGPRRPRQGGGADPRGARRLRREPASRRGHPRGHLPVQEQHRLGRQLLRLPRELPDEPAGRLLPLRPGADPVLREPADLLRRGQGAPDRPRGDVLSLPARRAHLGGGLVGDDAQPARSSTPATSRTPTPSASGACT